MAKHPDDLTPAQDAARLKRVIAKAAANKAKEKANDARKAARKPPRVAPPPGTKQTSGENYVRTNAPAGELIPQPHGGALRTGGTHKGGPGRTPNIIRNEFQRLLSKYGPMAVHEILTGVRQVRLIDPATGKVLGRSWVLMPAKDEVVLAAVSKLAEMTIGLKGVQSVAPDAVDLPQINIGVDAAPDESVTNPSIPVPGDGTEGGNHG